jgi:hypothetical protein
MLGGVGQQPSAAVVDEVVDHEWCVVHASMIGGGRRRNSRPTRRSCG